jgi:hypothetical protein
MEIGLVYGTFAFAAKLGKRIVCLGGRVFDPVLNQGVSDYSCVLDGFAVIDAGTLLIFR